MSARRAPAPGAGRVRLEVDWSRCRGHGHCAELLPELVRPDPWGYPIVGSTSDGVATAEVGVVPRERRPPPTAPSPGAPTWPSGSARSPEVDGTRRHWRALPTK